MCCVLENIWDLRVQAGSKHLIEIYIPGALKVGLGIPPCIRSSNALQTANPCISIESMSEELLLYWPENHGRVLQHNVHNCVIGIDLQLQR
jgi:hypothetical protein